MFKMTKSIVVGLVSAVLVVILAVGLNSLVFHWSFTSPNKVKTEVAPAGPAQISKIVEEILDCRALIFATVPIEGKKVHHFVFDYRTDTIKLVAYGDVEACVFEGAIITETDDGGWLVSIPAKSIVFNRPRVEAGKTAESIDYEKGWVGKITDSFPWVDDNSGLLPSSYAYAQDIIGSSKCMKVAWATTKQAVIRAYQKQAHKKGIPSGKVEVSFDGEPDFNQGSSATANKAFQGFDFKVQSDGVECVVLPGALR